MPADTETLFGLGAAIGGGLLVGIERERHKGAGPQREPAGVRSFTVVALVGAVSALLGPSAVCVGAAAVAAMGVASHFQSASHDPGLTTELALLATFFLGALALGSPQLGAGLFVVLAALLQSKDALHHFTQRVLDEREIDDALLLAASALIVLPLLPDRPIDPWDALNPRKLWLFAVLVMAINAAGYVALRAFGGGRGLLLAGFFGGFVSSSATIAGMGQRSKQSPGLRRSCIAAGLLSCVPTVIQIAVILGVVAPDLLRHLALPIASTGTVAAIVALVVARGAARPVDDANADLKGRPFAFGQALLFAGIVAVTLLLSKLLRAELGEGGALAVAAAAGFADVHAATVSVGDQVRTGASALHEASMALAAAFTTNSIMKAVASGTGGLPFAAAVIAGVAVLNVVFVAGVVWM